MQIDRKLLISLGLAPAVVAWSLTGHAHGPVARESEARDNDARIFTADAASGDVIVIDLPGDQIVARISTPPYIMSLGLSADRRHVFAMRGRNTERDWITVIDTGLDQATGQLQLPYVARTLPGASPGGIREDQLANVGGHDAIFMEVTGALLVMRGNDFTGLGAIPHRTYPLAAPDHYHYLEAAGYLYVGHLRNGFLQVIERDSGEEVARIQDCPVLHGMARDLVHDRVLFSCANHTIVVGTTGAETNQLLTRIPYPTEQRVSAFRTGKDGILWGFAEGTLPALYRLDTKADEYRFDVLPVERAIQQNTSEDGQHLLVLTRAGMLDIRDGDSGELQHHLQVTEPFAADFHEHVDKAVLPGIAALEGRAYVALPNEGVIAVIEIGTGALVRRIEVGGEPTRIVMVDGTSSASVATAP